MHQAAEHSAKAIVSFGLDPVRLVGQLASQAQELVSPISALLSLDSIFVTDLDKKTTFVQQTRQFTSQSTGPGRQVVNHKIGNRIQCCFYTDFLVAAGELIDQEDQTAGPRHELFIRRALDPGHGLLVDFPGQDTGLEKPFGRIEIQVIGGDHTSERIIQIGLDGFVDHAELVSKLAVGTGRIENA